MSKTAQEKINELMEETRNLSKAIFCNEVRPLFEKYPDLESFSWEQYTPYFNDGDECLFKVGDVDLINDKDDNEIHGTLKPNGRFGAVYEYSKPHPLYPAWKDLNEFVYKFNKNHLKMMFDDHVAVKVVKNKDGLLSIHTEECDHE